MKIYLNNDQMQAVKFGAELTVDGNTWRLRDKQERTENNELFNDYIYQVPGTFSYFMITIPENGEITGTSSVAEQVWSRLVAKIEWFKYY